MPVYFITGKLGTGKTLIAVSKMRDYLIDGRPIATNIDINLDTLIGKKSKKCIALRVPDKPTVDDLDAIGIGNDTYDEEKNGALFLDECGTWFNSRSWNDKKRQPIINWLLHARKKGWDVYFIIQDISIVDNQARVAFAEHVVYCRRMDRMKIPFFSWFFGLFGFKIMMPKIHIGVVKYGDQPTSLVLDRWVYRGTDLYDAYDTKQCFVDNPGSTVFRYLPPWYTHGRYEQKTDGELLKRIRKIYFENKLQINALFVLLLILIYSMRPGFQIKEPIEELATISPSVKTFEENVIEQTVSSKKQSEDNLFFSSDPIVIKLQEKLNTYIKIVGWIGGDNYIFKMPNGLSMTTKEARYSGFDVVSINRCRALLDGVEARCI